MSDRGSAKAWVLAFIAFAGVGLGALIGVGCALGANTCPFRTGEAFTSTDGQTIWLARCAFCHGRSGEGGRGPSLVAGSVAALTRGELEAKIARGRPLGGMPAFRRELSATQIAAVARYVVELRGAPDAEAS